MTVPEQSFEPDWTSVDLLAIHPVNQFVTQVGPASGKSSVPDGIYLALGTAAPPIFLGTPERVAAQVRDYGPRVPVTAVARLVLTRERAAELASALLAAVTQYDAVVGNRSAQEVPDA